MRTPETLTATQRAARLKLTGREFGEASAAPDESSNEPPVNNKQDRYRDQARESLNVGAPRNATANLDPRAEADMSFSLLEIDDVEEYRFNPRTGVNPRYEDIKASIRADGITNMLTVTRRPGASKYSPYGGGNTRLKIARELFLEGDRRFARLNVLVKAWPGEAGVISAHLAENENRGDISFWEKAQGVSSFKREFEAATGRVLTANELNKELRQLGLNYGIKMIQNFAFSVDNLQPVGPWLRSKELNAVIRPGISSYFDIGDTLGIRAELSVSIQQVLEQRHSQLVALQQRNDNRDESERVPVELDVITLMQELQDAVAAALGVESESVPLMASVLDQNPRIDADGLRRARIKPVVPTSAPTAARRTAGRDVASPQIPLGGMLAPVRSADEPASAAGNPSSPGHQLDTAPRPQMTDAAAELDPASEHALQRDLEEIHACMLALNELVPIYDMLNTVPAMPFGFLCDFPEEDLARIEGQPVGEPAADYRIVLWKLLVILSGQLDQRVSMRVSGPDSPLRWVNAIAAGPEAFAQAVLEKGHAHYTNGDIYASGLEVAMLFDRDDVGSAVVRLLSTLQRFRSRYPQRFPMERMPLFSGTSG